jgi:serine phosphatase RsbU (regulator of sigma subunit)
MVAAMSADELPQVELRLRLAQEAARLGYWDYEPATSRMLWDEGCVRIFGLEPGDTTGSLDAFDALCHPDDLPAVHAALARAQEGAPIEMDYRVRLGSGQDRHVLARGQAVLNSDGEVERVVGVVLDLTDIRGADLRERQAAERLASLATVAIAMAHAQDDHDLTRLVIEHGANVLGADGGAVAVRDDIRGVVRLAMTASLGEEAQRDYGELPLDGPLPGCWTARTGEALFLPDRAAGLAFTPMMEIVYDGTLHDAWAVLPLRGAERLLGSLLVSWEQPRSFPDDERDLLEAFAAQTAQALDRIQSLQAERRLAREARQLTETLQRSLLSSPPRPPGMQVAVRYSAAAEQAAVGGDWYDGFLTPDGTLSLVIGDCVGHDNQAAATMAVMRNLLRGTGWAVRQPPAAVLSVLEEALQGLEVGALATALLAQVTQDVDQVVHGQHTLRWSSAGHLPPVLALPDGGARVLRTEPDLLLGLSTESVRSDAQVLLPHGSTVLLYTDGLVERRDEDLDVGIERLRDLVARTGRLPLEELCDVVLEGMSHGRPEDDIALLALRTAPRD